MTAAGKVYRFPSTNNAAITIGAGKAQSLGQFQRGQRVAWRPRYWKNLVNVATAPTETVWGGPWIRLTPLAYTPGVEDKRKASLPGRQFVYETWGANETFSDESGATVSAGAGLAPLLQEQVPFYEVDFMNREIAMPFDGELAIYGERSMTLGFDLFFGDQQSSARPPDDVEREYTWTRNVYPAGGVQVIPFPLGCVGWEAIGTIPANNAAIRIALDDTATTAGLGFGRVPLNNVANNTTGRLPCAGGRGVQITPASLTDIISVCCYVRF